MSPIKRKAFEDILTNSEAKNSENSENTVISIVFPIAEKARGRKSVEKRQRIAGKIRYHWSLLLLL